MANSRRAPGQRNWEIRTFPSECKKISFKTKADARRWLKKKRGQPNFSAKHAYHCTKCDGWHVSHLSQPLRHASDVRDVESNGQP